MTNAIAFINRNGMLCTVLGIAAGFVFGVFKGAWLGL